MIGTGFTAADRAQLAAQGISLTEAERQLELLGRTDGRLRLDRPCRPGDGIRRLTPAAQAACIAAWEAGASRLTAVKFVPASGAASRMFADLAAFRAGPDRSPAALAVGDAGGDPVATAIRRFAEGLPRLAFHDSLARSLAAAGRDLGLVLAAGDLTALVDHLLAPEGLGYADTPKALIEFHRYPEGARTAFAEQLVEGLPYLGGGVAPARFHFTVSAAHRARFAAALGAFRAGRALPGGLAVDFSTQSPATDCLAADLAGRPFRLDGGRLLLRPGGHGALLANLGALAADVAFVKNIDNVLPEPRQGEVVRWKKVLGGFLLALREPTFAHLERLRAHPGPEDLHTARRFVAGELGESLPAAADAAAERRLLLDRLDRPLRVCGVVPNAGEPGGGPFWVRGAAGETRPQIVEASEVDRDDPEQAACWAAATHFNPVDLACSLSDSRGRPYDLDRFQDPTAVFLSVKTHEGRPLRVLERPGLWNGAMARWNTVFVEVPAATFAPVKTVLDLLRAEHQP